MAPFLSRLKSLFAIRPLFVGRHFRKLNGEAGCLGAMVGEKLFDEAAQSVDVPEAATLAVPDLPPLPSWMEEYEDFALLTLESLVEPDPSEAFDPIPAKRLEYGHDVPPHPRGRTWEECVKFRTYSSKGKLLKFQQQLSMCAGVWFLWTGGIETTYGRRPMDLPLRWQRRSDGRHILADFAQLGLYQLNMEALLANVLLDCLVWVEMKEISTDADENGLYHNSISRSRWKNTHTPEQWLSFITELENDHGGYFGDFKYDVPVARMLLEDAGFLPETDVETAGAYPTSSGISLSDMVLVQHREYDIDAVGPDAPYARLFHSIENRDEKLFREALPFFAPEYAIAPDAIAWPAPQFAGSICGLCVSKNWRDGLSVLHDSGVNPDRNRLTRTPLLEALYNRDPDTIRLLLGMGADPTAPVLDDRHAGIARSLPLIGLNQFEDNLGTLDRSTIDWSLGEGKSFQVRSAIGRHLLNHPQKGDSKLLTALMEADWEVDDDTRYYAQFFYFKCRLAGLRRDADMVRELFSFTPDAEVVQYRLMGFL